MRVIQHRAIHKTTLFETVIEIGTEMAPAAATRAVAVSFESSKPIV